MNKVILCIIAFSSLILSLQAQDKAGTIKFTEVMKLNIDLGDQAEAMKDMIPTSQSSEMILRFNANESMYTTVQVEKKKASNMDAFGNDFVIDIEMPETKIYTNTSTNEYLEEDDIFSKKFLITDELDTKNWKVKGEQKKVMEYVCQKAVLQTEQGETVAWFTPKITAQMGPRGYGGLPGMILAIEQEGGDFKAVATQVDFTTEEKIDRPKKGKKVSREEFEKIRKVKMEEAGFSSQDGGGFIQIKVETDDGFK